MATQQELEQQIQKAAADVNKWMADHNIVEPLADDLLKDVQDYMAAHPEQMEKIGKVVAAISKVSTIVLLYTQASSIIRSIKYYKDTVRVWLTGLKNDTLVPFETSVHVTRNIETGENVYHILKDGTSIWDFIEGVNLSDKQVLQKLATSDKAISEGLLELTKIDLKHIGTTNPLEVYKNTVENYESSAWIDSTESLLNQKVQQTDAEYDARAKKFEDMLKPAKEAHDIPINADTLGSEYTQKQTTYKIKLGEFIESEKASNSFSGESMKRTTGLPASASLQEVESSYINSLDHIIALNTDMSEVIKGKTTDWGSFGSSLQEWVDGKQDLPASDAFKNTDMDSGGGRTEFIAGSVAATQMGSSVLNPHNITEALKQQIIKEHSPTALDGKLLWENVGKGAGNQISEFMSYTVNDLLHGNANALTQLKTTIKDIFEKNDILGAEYKTAIADVIDNYGQDVLNALKEKIRVYAETNGVGLQTAESLFDANGHFIGINVQQLNIPTDEFTKMISDTLTEQINEHLPTSPVNTPGATSGVQQGTKVLDAVGIKDVTAHNVDSITTNPSTGETNTGKDTDLLKATDSAELVTSFGKGLVNNFKQVFEGLKIAANGDGTLAQVTIAEALEGIGAAAADLAGHAVLLAAVGFSVKNVVQEGIDHGLDAAIGALFVESIDFASFGIGSLADLIGLGPASISAAVQQELAAITINYNSIDNGLTSPKAIPWGSSLNDKQGILNGDANAASMQLLQSAQYYALMNTFKVSQWANTNDIWLQVMTGIYSPSEINDGAIIDAWKLDWRVPRTNYIKAIDNTIAAIHKYETTNLTEYNNNVGEIFYSFSKLVFTNKASIQNGIMNLINEVGKAHQVYVYHRDTLKNFADTLTFTKTWLTNANWLFNANGVADNAAFKRGMLRFSLYAKLAGLDLSKGMNMWEVNSFTTNVDHTITGHFQKYNPFTKGYEPLSVNLNQMLNNPTVGNMKAFMMYIASTFGSTGSYKDLMTTSTTHNTATQTDFFLNQAVGTLANYYNVEASEILALLKLLQRLRDLNTSYIERERLETIIRNYITVSTAVGTNVQAFNQVDTQLATQLSVQTQQQNVKNSKGKNKKRRRRHKKTKGKPNKKPKYIKRIKINTSSWSEWIQSMTFEFYTKAKKDSDDFGRLTFRLKKGGVITKHRVKRGTFSAITIFIGPGYKFWSQFQKNKIVNTSVLSYQLARIGQEERSEAIREELADNLYIYE